VPIDEDQLWQIVIQGLEEAEHACPDAEEEDDDGAPPGDASVLRQIVAACLTRAESRARDEWKSFEREER